MKLIEFSTVEEILANLQGRSIALFGAGGIAGKTLKLLGHRCIAILDNSEGVQGTCQAGVEIIAPVPFLAKRRNDVYVVICTSQFNSVGRQLIELGLAPGKDFAVTPVLNDLRIISEMDSCEANLLFASGTAPNSSSSYGGGVYQLCIAGHQWSLKKLYDGNCYAFLRESERLIIVDNKLGLFSLNQEGESKLLAELPARSNCHGIGFSELTGNYYLAANYHDSVIWLDKNFEIRGELRISDKIDYLGEHAHHLNDLWIQDSSLYVSMFSYSGNWRRGVFDGVLLEIDLRSHKVSGIVYTDLWMPHNPMIINGSMHVLDSLRGELLRDNKEVIGRFPGFSRGLAFDGRRYFVGQSRNRNSSKIVGVSKNISLDTSVIVFDGGSKVSRSIPLDPRLSEVHAIECLPAPWLVE